MSHRLLWHRVVSVRAVPAVISKVGDRNPALVDVDDMSAFRVDLKHLSSVQVPEDFILLRIANMRNPLDTTVAVAELVLQDFADRSKWDTGTSALARFKLDLFGVPDVLLIHARRMNSADYASFLSRLQQFRLSLVDEQDLLLLQVFYQLVDNLHLDVE